MRALTRARKCTPRAMGSATHGTTLILRAWACMVCWLAPRRSEQVGMSEHDAFHYALEISLDSVGKRDDDSHASSALLQPACTAGAPAGGRASLRTRLAAKAAARGGGGGGGGGDGDCRDDGNGSDEDEGRWETVAAAARPRDRRGVDAAGNRYPMSHPHLGSACEERAGVQFELDEYGRVRHFGSLPLPRQGAAVEPSPVLRL